jgi:hypothetical protein
MFAQSKLGTKCKCERGEVDKALCSQCSKHFLDDFEFFLLPHKRFWAFYIILLRQSRCNIVKVSLDTQVVFFADN